jgi:hypothetical protein
MKKYQRGQNCFWDNAWKIKQKYDFSNRIEPESSGNW